MQYLLLIHKNADTNPTDEEWKAFIEEAFQSGLFKGGSELGNRTVIGSKEVNDIRKSMAVL
tara:strand:+ start:1751 stop:1933 length:183 start_codon:yes stop_codon:yes gene_type:complete